MDQLSYQFMKASLEALIRSMVKQPAEQEVQEILAIFKERHYQKGEVFKQSHTISQELGFIVSGSARSYVVKRNGDEITGEVNLSGKFITDLISTRTQEQTPIIIECLEDSTLLVASIESMQALLETNLAFNIMLREYVADGAVEVGKRLILFLTGTARERYEFMLQHHPGLLEKFPLRLIASLIGITPTQLSRIRNQK